MHWHETPCTVTAACANIGKAFSSSAAQTLATRVGCNPVGRPVRRSRDANQDTLHGGGPAAPKGKCRAKLHQSICLQTNSHCSGYTRMHASITNRELHRIAQDLHRCCSETAPKCQFFFFLTLGVFKSDFYCFKNCTKHKTGRTTLGFRATALR